MARGRVADKVALVTGAGRGIGREIALALAREGARVAALARTRADVESVAEEIRKAGGKSIAFACDVCELSQVEAAVRETTSALGAIDVLVNNAGTAGRPGPTASVDPAMWRSVLAVNVDGAFHCARAVIPSMTARKWGRIVNVASVAGKEGNPMLAAYSTAKAALIGFTKSLGKELATTGVLVNCVTPAVIGGTDMVARADPTVLQGLVDKIPMKRVGTTAEVAEMVVWLSSDACSFSTAAVFDLSGGRATY